MNEIRIRVRLNNDESARWQELKDILGIDNNAKAFKKIISVIKL